MRIDIHLPPLATSVADARATIRRALGTWSPGVDEEGLQLALSEIVTNAVVHAPGTNLVVRMRWTDDHLEVGVTDFEPTTAPRLLDRPPEAESGRGMRIVEAIADEWGTRRDGDTKTVWFRLHSDRKPPAGSP